MWVMDIIMPKHIQTYFTIFFSFLFIAIKCKMAFYRRVAFNSDNDSAQGFHHSQWLVSRQQPVWWLLCDSFEFQPFPDIRAQPSLCFIGYSNRVCISSICFQWRFFFVHACVNPFSIAADSSTQTETGSFFIHSTKCSWQAKKCLHVLNIYVRTFKMKI